MVNHQYKCIFIEVPKTGSTSIRDVLGHPPKPHLDISEIKAEIDDLIFEEYFKFGLIRNPWDRVVSLYLRNEGLTMKDKMSFEDFVYWIQNSSDTCIHPTPKKNQLDWFTDVNGQILVDRIYKFEKLEEAWEDISKKINVYHQLPHLNKNANKKRHYTEFYTLKTKEVIERKFAIDINYFSYQFGT